MHQVQTLRSQKLRRRKQAAQEGLAQVQNSIGSLESKKQELESYLADLNAQYEDLTNSISELSIQAAEKEDELNKVKTELEKAKKASADQYESMKLRIAYMYENAGTSALETLLSSESLAEFLNRAENAIQILHMTEICWINMSASRRISRRMRRRSRQSQQRLII